MFKLFKTGMLEVEPEPEAIPEAAGGLPLWQIGDGCSWPVSEDLDRLLFCGQRRIGRRSYCARHLAIAYAASNTRRKPSIDDQAGHDVGRQAGAGLDPCGARAGRCRPPQSSAGGGGQ